MKRPAKRVSDRRRGGGAERLAIDGGTRAVHRLGRQPGKLGAAELCALVDLWRMRPETRSAIHRLIRSDPSLRGPHLFRYYGPRPGRVERAEAFFARMIGVKHALGMNSCTSALIAALRALGVGAGDEVIVPAYTFFATAASVVVCNAVPVICEVDDSLGLDAAAAERSLTRRTRAVIAVHMRGAPAAMDAIMDLARRKGLPVVEDVAQACGGAFGGKRLGAIGTVGCFSFDYAKLAVSGEGGFLTTDDDYLFMRAQSWHDTAACWRPDRYAPERVKGELFCGENYRMSELQGAVALAQMRRLDALIRRLRRNKRRVRDAIDEFPGMAFRRIPDPSGDVGNVLIFFVPDAGTKERIVAAMKAEGIPAAGPYSPQQRDWHVYVHWDHILRRRAVARDGLPWSAIPHAELPRYSRRMCPRTLDLLGRAVSVAIGPDYSAADCRAIARGINKVLRHFLV